MRKHLLGFIGPICLRCFWLHSSRNCFWDCINWKISSSLVCAWCLLAARDKWKDFYFSNIFVSPLQDGDQHPSWDSWWVLDTKEQLRFTPLALFSLLPSFNWANSCCEKNKFSSCYSSRSTRLCEKKIFSWHIEKYLSLMIIGVNMMLWLLWWSKIDISQVTINSQTGSSTIFTKIH